jgi:nicotinamidase/pyrazinamidase
MTKKALLIVDLQNDFLPGGALAVANGDHILPIIKDLMSLSFDSIIASKDWHPVDHVSFASVHHQVPGETLNVGNQQQILWPIHCVQESSGAEFPPTFPAHKLSKIVYKGSDRSVDSYSAFFNANSESTGLSEYLSKNHINTIYVVGLATDYCVKHSVLDALAFGFHTTVITDACQGVNLNPHDSRLALEQMKEAGAVLMTSKDIFK